MHKPSTKNRLHGLTLETILTRLEAHYGWQELGEKIPIACFLTHPSISSSLKFLRRTAWARQKVERLYLHTPFSVQERLAFRNEQDFQTDEIR